MGDRILTEYGITPACRRGIDFPTPSILLHRLTVVLVILSKSWALQLGDLVSQKWGHVGI